MKLRAREAAAEAILEAVEDVAAERGLEATSIAAIAERAGVAVGTLYNYFPDREHLLRALFKKRRASLVPAMDAAAEAARDLPFEARVRSYLRGVVAAFSEHRKFLRVVMSADQSLMRIHGRQNVLMPKIGGELEAILRPIVGDAAEVYARMVLGAVKAVLHWRVEQGKPIVPDADLIVDAFLSGIPRA
jgi:AcrR family transcriptional regulator